MDKRQSKKGPGKRLLICLLLSLSFVNPGLAEGTQISPAKAKQAVSALASITGLHSQEMSRDGADFLQEMHDAAEALKSYSFQSHQTVFKSDKVIEENSRFYFKKPRQIRAEELGPFKKGSVAVLLKNGKVKGHLGGIMSKFVATVSSDSEWVRSANDYPLVDSDFLGMANVMLQFVKAGKKCLATETPVSVKSQPAPVYVIELYTNPQKDELMKRAYIDPQTLLPVEWFDYKNGKLFAHTRWKDVQLNIDIDDSKFDL